MSIRKWTNVSMFSVETEQMRKDAMTPQTQEEFRVGFFACYDRIWDLINLRNDTQHYQEGFFVHDVPTFNERVVREAVLNAVSHRNYQMAGSVFVRQYRDRLVVESPGGFPYGISVDNIIDRQVPRNRRIAEILALCGLVERSGQGMNLMYELSIMEAKALPDFAGTDDNFVSLTLNGMVIDKKMLTQINRIGNDRLALKAKTMISWLAHLCRMKSVWYRRTHNNWQQLRQNILRNIPSCVMIRKTDGGSVMGKNSDYRNSWISENLDRINLTVPKGRKRELSEVALAQKKSVNGFINEAINEKIEAEQKQNMKIYTIIGGVNGAGKSSFTGVLKESRKDLGRIIDVDKITAQLGGNALEGGKESIRRIDDCLKKGISFTQETTLSGYRTERTAKKAMEAGYFVRLYYVGLNTAQESLDRIANRVKRGGHNIPESDVLRRFEGRWEAVAKVLPYCNEAEFYDNDNGFVKVGEYRNGELILVGEHRPAWILELKGHVAR